MHAILSYHGNRPTHTHKHTQYKQDQLQYTVPLSLACSVTMLYGPPSTKMQTSQYQQRSWSGSIVSDIVTPVTHLPGCFHLHSAKNGDYNCPRVPSAFGRRSFSVSGPDAWNSLPRQLRGIAVASTFKRHLKSELFPFSNGGPAT